jgi:hypothetical protein
MQTLEVFRPSLKAILRSLLKGALWYSGPLVALAVYRAHLSDEDLATAILWGIGWFCTPVLLATLFSLLVYAYEYKRAPALEPDGIVGLDTLQRRYRVSWDKICAVEMQSFAGLQEVAISVQGTYWRVRVPLYLQQRARFESLLKSYAGEEHPLAQAVRGEA